MKFPSHDVRKTMPVPTTLHFRTRCVSSFSWNIDILWQEGRLIVSQLDYPEERTPSETDWEEFWKEAEAIGVWKWKQRYEHKRIAVLDGISWDLHLKTRAKEVRTDGSNCYPGTKGIEPSPSFLRLVRAFEKLAKFDIEAG